MQLATPLNDELTKERELLARAGRLHWIHWAIILLSGLVTSGAWYFAKSQVEEKSRSQFDRESSHVLELVQERMQKYEDALWGGVAAIQSQGGKMQYTEWQTFAQSLHIDTKYPGISGIGVIQYVSSEDLAAHVAFQRLQRSDYNVHPMHSQNEYLPIVFIEPEAPNAKAVGLDMAHETNRYATALKARDEGVANITGPIVLVQDEGSTPGFLFYAPYYAGGRYNDINERRQSFAGMVYAPFTVSNLMEGTLRKENRRVGIRLSDSGQLMYDENVKGESDFDPNPLFTTERSVELYGRSWTFEVWSTKSFRNASNSHQPKLILIGGITIDLLLFGIFLLLSRASRRTLRFADRMNFELEKKAAELMESNSDLERFAYVTSHDLKTPLRGIADLTTYIEEDLEEYVADSSANPDVQHNLKRIYKQTGRMENLINGILDYSSVGTRQETVKSVNVGAMVDMLAGELGVRDDQLVFEGEPLIIDTYLVRFSQVLNNLVGNAFKYHHDPSSALVTVSYDERPDFYSFSVSDNGPGIDPKFHSRIFEVFQTLQSKDEIESTGVGLSIVKKSVEALGGRVTVSSELGQGTTFQFDWPKANSFSLQKSRAAN